MALEFEYVKSAQRYRWKDSKKFVSAKLVEKLTVAHSDQMAGRVKGLTRKMLDGDLTVDEWERQVLDDVKEVMVQRYRLGKGGDLDASDRGKLGSQLRFNYDKFWTFRQKVIEGELSEAQIFARAQLYVNKANWAYAAGRTQAHKNAGYIWEQRIKPATESCMECIVYNLMGWQPIGSLPERTEQCTCQANCKCYKEFSDSVIKPSNNAFTSPNPLNPVSLESAVLTTPKPMKVTLEIPDNLENASCDQVQAALEAAQAAFNLNLEKDVAANEAVSTLLKGCDREEIENIIKLSIEKALGHSPDCGHAHNDSGEDIDPDEVEANRYNTGTPSEEEFEKIKEYLPNKGMGRDRSEFMKAAFVASNNFLWRSKGAWSPTALQTMTMQYPGRPFIFDHAYSVKNVVGFVFDAEYSVSRSVPKRILEQVSSESNYNILNNDGYIELIAHACYDKSCQFSQELMTGIYSDVSTGCNVDPDSYKCPLDNSYFGEGDRWYQCAGGHNMPGYYLESWYYNKKEKDNLAPYYIIDKVVSTIELSAVIMGNLPAASLLRERKAA